jgi:DNA modification methylase
MSLSQSSAKKKPIRAERPAFRSKFHDLDLKNWKSYPELITDSLWALGSRGKASVHKGDYHGNFVPQIPEQVMRRFTRAGDVVLDMFCGMATTLIECRRLGRHGLGVELQTSVCQQSQARLQEAENPHGVHTSVLCGDSACSTIVGKVQDALAPLGRQRVDHVLLHPPYWDIINFTNGEDERDLSSFETLDGFLEAFEAVVCNGYDLLEPGRFMTLVIGDKYAGGEWIPLAFECMDVMRSCGLTLRAINIKDIQGNEKAKGKNNNLWRYRALRNGLYVFKHEYVMIFKKD